MSFFEEGDEPRTAIATPRRAPSRPAGGRRPPLDDRTLLTRRAGAIVGAIVLIVIIVFATKAYLSSEQTQSLKNYNNEVSSLVSEEQSQVAVPFFNTLATSSGVNSSSVVTLQTAVVGDAVTARQDAAQAAGWSVPAQMAGAQQNLLLVLDLRAEALNEIQADIPAAVDSNGSNAAPFERIAGAMGLLYSSDVIYAVRVRPLIAQALTSAGIPVASSGGGGIPVSGEQVIASQFLPSESWLLTSYVAGKIIGNTPSSLGGPPSTGTSGHKLIGVTVGSTPLTTGLNQIHYTKGLGFTVSFENSGDNPEYGVGVSITLQSATVSPVTAMATERVTEPGQTYAPTLVFPGAVPEHTTLELVVKVSGVPGEKDLANNTQTYYVVFS